MRQPVLRFRNAVWMVLIMLIACAPARTAPGEAGALQVIVTGPGGVEPTQADRP
jgi:hypothetical protein